MARETMRAHGPISNTQLPTKTPTIAFFCNLPQYIKPPYPRYLENRLREHFDFTGVPITLVFRKK
jgi:GTP-binding protein